MARALAHGEIILEVAARKGVKISVDGSGLRECMESSSIKDIQSKAARKHCGLLVSAAREAGVYVDRLLRMPMDSHGTKKDESVQVSLLADSVMKNCLCDC